MQLKVVINGTSENPYHKLGLKQNPFPQIAKAELTQAMTQLNKLAAEPIKSKEQIADILKGWSDEFVKLCQDRFVPGERVQFMVSFPRYK